MHGHLEFGLTWTPQQQEFTARGLRFLHEGQTPTFPSHDLAHLLIAAMPALEWHPTKMLRSDLPSIMPFFWKQCCPKFFTMFCESLNLNLICSVPR